MVRGTNGRRRRCTTRVQRRRRRQKGAIFPLALLPLLALAGKATATGAIGGAAGYGAKKAIEAATRRR